MPKSKHRKHGIFCLENDWWGLEDGATIEPALQTLAKLDKVPFLHRDVATKAEFDYYVDKWTEKRMAAYPVLYLGFHGDKGVITVERKRRSTVDVTLDELESRLAGKCSGRMLHFASCATVALHGSRLNRFLRNTGAVALAGFRADIDWLDAAAFELLFLGKLQDISMTKTGMRALDRRVREVASGLAKRLDFRLHVHP